MKCNDIFLVKPQSEYNNRTIEWPFLFSRIGNTKLYLSPIAYELLTTMFVKK